MSKVQDLEARAEAAEKRVEVLERKLQMVLEQRDEARADATHITQHIRGVLDLMEKDVKVLAYSYVNMAPEEIFSAERAILSGLLRHEGHR